MRQTAEIRGCRPEDRDEIYTYRLTGQVVLTVGVEEGWADPTDPRKVDFRKRPSFMGPIEFDNAGKPLNPHRTDYMLGDRGALLGKWGPNNAADSVVFTKPTAIAERKVLLIRRSDGSHQWAVPGGMVNPGEQVSAAASRELREEANIDLSKMESKLIYEGYVDDPRNTRNSWMETTARMFELDYTPQPRAGTDAIDARWFDCSDVESLIRATQEYDVSLGLEPQPLYADHHLLVGRGLLMLAA